MTLYIVESTTISLGQLLALWYSLLWCAQFNSEPIRLRTCWFPSGKSEMHLWLVLCALLLLTVLSVIVITRAILNNKGILRKATYDFNTKANA